MALNRDTLLKDLREHVIEVFFLPEAQLSTTRLTLRVDLLPGSFINDPEQLNEMEQFHRINRNYIAAWNVNKKHWARIPIDSIQYVQMLDGY